MTDDKEGTATDENHIDLTKESERGKIVLLLTTTTTSTTTLLLQF